MKSMSIRPNNNKGSAKYLPVIIFGIVFVLVLINLMNSSKRNRHRGTPVSAQPAPVVKMPFMNPLLEMLNESAGPTRTPGEGIAIGVAIDVSGSMNDSVKDTDGLARPKIEIARRCALDILKQADSFAHGHEDQKIEVGIFEFSSRQHRPSCRQVVPFGPIQTAAAVQAVKRMRPEGGTPIGDAMIAVKQKMNATALSRQHLLVITDGENNQGYDPGDVVNALSRMPDEKRASVYFFAFDVSTDKFRHVRDSGGLVMAASNGQELEQTLG
ncbi:MAG: VWA domain-containing protein, partial [Sedimentisphaerales bacterium]|nr:VWA domain-containing protein [Sedimentisphaerales bacterium]